MNNYKGTKITIGDDTYEFEGTKDYNELENKPDLTIYAEKENTYTKDEVDTAIREAETTLELAIEEKVDTTTYNDKIDEIEAVLEGKANKSDIPSMDDYVDKDSYNAKMEAVDNAIATKADTETVNSRFSSVDEYLDDLRTEVDKKADASSLEDYVTEGEYTAKIEAIDNAIATKADAEETANRFSSVDDYLEQLHTEIEGKADQDNTYTKEEVDLLIAGAGTGVSKEYVDGEISRVEGEIPSLSGYATEQWVEGKGYLTEHQSLDNYYTKGETDNAIQNAKDSLEGEINSKTEIIQLKNGSSLYVYTKLYEDIVKWVTDGNYIASYPVLFKINNNVGYYTPIMYDSLAGRITFRETYYNGLRWGSIKNRLELYSGESYSLNSNGILSMNTGSSSSTYVAGVAQVSDIPTKTSELTNDSGFLTEHQSLDNYYTNEETDNAIQGTKTALEGEINTKVDTTTYEVKISEIEEVLGTKADRTEIPSLAGYATETWVEVKGYLTEHQKLKTINGETIIGTGDIEIKGEESIYNLNKMSQSECKTLYNELVANWNDRGKYIISYTYTSNYQTFFVVPYLKSSTYLYMSGTTGYGTQELYSLTIKLNSDGSFTKGIANATLATQPQLSEVAQRVSAVETKVDNIKAPTGTSEFPLVGINETTNVEVYINKPQGIIPPNNEIWYKTTDGEGSNIMDVFMDVTDMDGHPIMYDVQYEDDGDLHKWVFLTDVGNIDIDWYRTEMFGRVTDLYLPSTVNYLRYSGTGMSLKHIAFGGNSLMLEGMMEEPVIIELYYDGEDNTVYINDESADPTQVTFKVPAEKLGVYIEQYNQFNFEAMEEQTELVIKPIATVEYVNAMMGGNSVFRTFRINSDNYTTDSTFLSAIEEVLNGHNPIGNYGIYNGEYPYVCEEFTINTDLQYVNMSFVEHSQTLHSIVRITLRKYDDVWEGTWTLQNGLVGYATESYVSNAVDTAKQGLQSDIDQKLNKDEYDAKMQTIDASLAGKVEHNEFVERCEAIEQSYLPLSGGTLTGNLTLGSTTETAYKKFEAIRSINGLANGAAFYVNSDGTAAFYHKSYNGSSATNDAILKFDTNGLQYAKSGSRTATASVFKNVLVDGDLQTEDWTFELEDGSTITKTIYLK